MTVSLFVVSESSSVDRETNVLSIFNIVDHIDPVSLPLSIPGLVLTIVLIREEGEPETIDGRISIANNEDTIVTLPSKVDFAGKRRTRLSARINGVPVRSPGTLIFKYTAVSMVDVAVTVPVSEPKPSQEHRRDAE